MRAELYGQSFGERVGTTDVAGEDGDDVLAQRVQTQDGGVAVLVVDERGDGADTDAHGTDEDKGVEVVPARRDIGARNDFASRCLPYLLRGVRPGFANLYDGYLLHLQFDGLRFTIMSL